MKLIDISKTLNEFLDVNKKITSVEYSRLSETPMIVLNFKKPENDLFNNEKISYNEFKEIGINLLEGIIYENDNYGINPFSIFTENGKTIMIEMEIFEKDECITFKIEELNNHNDFYEKLGEKIEEHRELVFNIKEWEKNIPYLNPIDLFKKHLEIEFLNKGWEELYEYDDTDKTTTEDLHIQLLGKEIDENNYQIISVIQPNGSCEIYNNFGTIAELCESSTPITWRKFFELLKLGKNIDSFYKHRTISAKNLDAKLKDLEDTYRNGYPLK